MEDGVSQWRKEANKKRKDYREKDFKLFSFVSAPMSLEMPDSRTVL